MVTTRNLKPTDVGANGFTIPNMVQRKDSDKRSGGYKRNGFVGADGKNLVLKGNYGIIRLTHYIF